LTPDQALLDAGLADLSAKLDVYEVILGKHKFLAGDVRIMSSSPRGWLRLDVIRCWLTRILVR
jgi:hypothetical protein